MEKKKLSFFQWFIILSVLGLIAKGVESCYNAVFPKSETEIMEEWMDNEMKRHGYQ
jgi:hypothetical protein